MNAHIKFRQDFIRNKMGVIKSKMGRHFEQKKQPKCSYNISINILVKAYIIMNTHFAIKKAQACANKQ